MDIQPQYLTIGRLLSGRLFRIPEYQRTYSWRAKERADLFNDILRVADNGVDKQHFLATVVGLRKDKKKILTDEFQVLEIVDGQQRITTLVILLRAIAKNLDQNLPGVTRVRTEIDELLVKPDSASLLLLQTNHDTSHHFSNYIRDGRKADAKTATTIADRELLNAINECEGFAQSWSGNTSQSMVDLVDIIKNRLTVILHEIADESIVYTVFEVLNSRGLDVSWFDRLKSMLMGIAFENDGGNRDEIIHEVHTLWSDIYRIVGLRIGLSSESLRFAATLWSDICPSRPLSEYDSVDQMKTHAALSPALVIETTEWLKKVTGAVDQLRRNIRLNAVTSVSQSRLLGTAIYLRADLNDNDKKEVLRRWENVTFRIYGMCGKDARTRVGEFVRLAWRVLNEDVDKNQMLSELTAIGSQFSIDDAVEGLRNEDCYSGWQTELLYIFYRYEEYLAKKKGQQFKNEQWNRIWMASASDSIEHIMPQSRADQTHVHRLGNLVVLPPGLNSTLQACEPVKKVDAYKNCGLLISQQVVPSLASWDNAAIEKREDELLNWARNEWSD